MQKSVYLAGPILGLTENEAKGWRQGVAHVLRDHNIVGISPLRCEPLIGERYAAAYDADPRFGTAKAIASKNLFDTRSCDMVLAYLPDTTSAGTLVEIGWASAIGTPVILVSKDERVLRHPILSSVASWIVPSFEDAIDIIVGVLGGYTGGKNV